MQVCSQHRRGAGVVLAAMAVLWPAVATAQSTNPTPPARIAIREKSPDAPLWVTFVSVPKGAPVRSIAGQGTLELGRITYLSGSTQDGVTVTQGKRTFTISTRFGLRVGVAENPGSAKLFGFLTQVNPAIRVAIDGVDLSPAPQVIEVAMKFGMVSEHRLDIEVPISMPEAAAQVLNAIAFQVIAN